MLSARSDKSSDSSSREQQLVKKTVNLEKENEDLKEKLNKQISINEAHRVKVDEDFEKWNKQKQWQRQVEKLKNKLKARNDEFEKLQATTAGFRLLIERIEKEKRTLEHRLKIMKSHNIHANANQQFENLALENSRLESQIELLQSKLNAQQHHSGGLAAALLQEKLEAQERKIAVLELAAKVSEVNKEICFSMPC